MAGRGPHGDRNLDDWFAEPEPAPRRTHRPVAGEDDATQTLEPAQPAAADDWLAESGPKHVPPRVRLDLAGARVWLTVAVLAVLLLVGLAAGGVFSAGHLRAQPTATTAPQAPTTTATTTTRNRVALPTSTLKPGDTGPQVRTLQRALATFGYSPGAVDGHYGPATQHAVARFQQASRLTADGIFGTKTLHALTRAAA